MALQFRVCWEKYSPQPSDIQQCTCPKLNGLQSSTERPPSTPKLHAERYSSAPLTPRWVSSGAPVCLSYLAGWTLGRQTNSLQRLVNILDERPTAAYALVVCRVVCGSEPPVMHNAHTYKIHSARSADRGAPLHAEVHRFHIEWRRKWV